VTRRAAAACLALAAAACSKPTQAILTYSELETYWAVDSAVGDTQYIAPVVLLHITNKSREPQPAVSVQVRVERKGLPGQDWGSADGCPGARRTGPSSPGRRSWWC
jgi:hypothetical protein